jgi:hypothetical protein
MNDNSSNEPTVETVESLDVPSSPSGNKRGRPAWIPTEETIRTVEKLSSQGLNQTQIADCLGIGLSTLFEKKAEYAEFAEAIKRGKALGVAHVTSKLMAKISAMDTTSILFYLKCRGDGEWRDAPDVTIQGNGSNKIEVVVTGGPPTDTALPKEPNE